MTDQIKSGGELESCPSCGALPCDWVDNPFSRTPAKAGEDGVERVARALCELRIRQVRKHDTAQDRLEEMMPAAVDHAWRDHEDEARVAISALSSIEEARG